MNAKARLALVATTAFQLYMASAMAAPHILSACGTISKPGSYVVEANLSATGNCLVVQADFVTIDLDGWVIRGNGTGAGISDLGAGTARGSRYATGR